MIYAELADFLTGLFHETIGPLSAGYFVMLAPIFAAIFLGVVFWEVWVRYVQLAQFLGLKYTILELRLPKDTFKSPLAMETVLHAIHNTSDGSHYAQFWKGETRPWYSLEIISIEGNVKFLIWTEDRRKSNLKAALYSQYPGIEIYEIPDYAQDFQWDPKVWKIWAAEFSFTQEGHSNAYPIKTYVDYGLDKDPKEEFKVDPLVHMLEWLGSLRPNEQAWFQFVVRAHKKEQRKAGHFWKQTDVWKDEATALVNKILMRDPVTKVSGSLEKQKIAGIFEEISKKPTISRGEQEIAEAVERKLQKLPFDVCVRGVYIAKKDIFDTPFGIGGVISSMKQFNTEHMNGFRPNGDKWIAKFDHPWQDYKDIRRNYLSKRFMMAYRRRSAFYPPYKTVSLILNTEELATIYHLPGAVAGTPTLQRVPSKKSEAPTNLPV